MVNIGEGCVDDKHRSPCVDLHTGRVLYFERPAIQMSSSFP
jgi:hypothetical protein